MSQEDREWLEAALKEYTFNDTDKLKEVCTFMEQDYNQGFKADNTEDMLLDLQEVVEVHERNSSNLARSGGL